MKQAFLYPGQASQYVGMGKDIVEHSPIARSLFEEANHIMNADLMRICFDGPEEELRQTKFTQPAIFVHSIALTRILNISIDAAAGHSLGEYSALVAANALTFQDGLRLVKKRGELMQESGVRAPGSMAAVIGAEESMVREVCVEVSSSAIVQAANFNSPGQIVISGSNEGITVAMELLKARGVRLVKKLPVSGAFHSSLMQYAQDELGSVLKNTPIADARFPVYTNATAEPVTKAKEIREMLFRQVTSPVLWEMSMRNMVRDGIEKYFECGPGTVLQGLLKRISPESSCVSIGSWEQANIFRKEESH